MDKKITDEDNTEYITTQQYNKLTSNNFASRLTQASLPRKTDIANFARNTDFGFQQKKNFTKANQKEFRNEKLIKKKGNKLHVKKK